ncbi:DUF3991 and toprim domain-containing protein [Bradyrhizobium sp. LHD-71]|uniref:DUF3991 and toprim domain-containing protein n=1 Tax=Bradyrhizobium sp. LHD-71 TaxID=3072141 RepID=UPI00280F75CB|nr:DUF3991 and toprim domain-containing protein [Bradyrhizobium sp. LHD-71]MDQ8727637.1 DUF3991 and toprim domain-containing protein [Bradyrhizobium sp. LHD-71]
MEKKEIEELRDRVGCAALLQHDGWKLDLKESTRRAIKYRRNASIVIVIHGDRGWFDPLSPAKGDVFDLAQHLGAQGFAQACDHVASLIGFVPSPQPWQRDNRVSPLRSIAERWMYRRLPGDDSPAWSYLTITRRLPAAIVAACVGQAVLREGPRGSIWAAHRRDDGELLGWEERGPQWRGFATGGSKELFRLGPSAASRICITEAAIDAMSVAAIEALRADTLYVSTGGGWAPASENAIRRLATHTNAQLVAATDNNRQGDVYADRIQRIAAETGAAYARSRPRAGDWNDDLITLFKRMPQAPITAVGRLAAARFARRSIYCNRLGRQ